jgi:hypothetical protein
VLAIGRLKTTDQNRHARAGFARNRSHVQTNEFKAQVAKTIKEACELAEAGFRYVAEM